MIDYVKKMEKMDAEIKRQSSKGEQVLCWFIILSFIAGVCAYAYQGVA